MTDILIADSSYLIRKGLAQLILEVDDGAHIFEAETEAEFTKMIGNVEFDIIFINTLFLPTDSFDNLMSETPQAIWVTISNSPLLLNSGENQFSIADKKPILTQKISNYLQRIQSGKKQIDTTEELTDRERLVLQQVALGLMNKEIADKLNISSHTVITHRKNITRKLGIKTVSGLTVYAILNNIIKMEDIS